MKNAILYALFILLVAGCTQQMQAYSVQGVYQSAKTDYNLDVLVTDELKLRTNTLFSGEMTRLTLNVLNLADVPFVNVRAIVINADDLHPTTDNPVFDLIEPNNSETFQWDLTAPRLGIGETLYLNNIKVRTYYETYAEASKVILLKKPGDRTYESTYSFSSASPIVLSFSTSYETVTTINNNIKNFTINMIYFNNYSGIIDYYDNSNITDNYVRWIVLGADKKLTFYNIQDSNTPWHDISSMYNIWKSDFGQALADENIAKLGLAASDLELKNYYLLKYETIAGSGIGGCGVTGLTPELSNMYSEQRRVLWMTRGTTKINVLRFGAPTVEDLTEVQVDARMSYGYSQDFGGQDFGAVIYGLG
ncbi:Uncharacterised protein [Candidatus Tiddalikarchaeum anstoanum]|nr:Uncharacterised protein [Candidatus Tiddalikarchaeum anstoanum]